MDDQPRSTTSRPWKIFAAVILSLGGVGLVFHALHYPFITDDAYISFRYSYNLAHHGELTFNLGDRVEGYTNFLWTVTLGLLLKAGLLPEVTSRVLGVFFGVISMVLLFLFTRLYRGGRLTGWDLLGALILPATAGFAVWCSGGLETQMFTALVLAGATLYMAEQGGRVRWRVSGLIFALAAMTRPEGLMLFGLTLGHRALANLAGQRRLRPTWAELGWLAGFLVPVGNLYLWRYSYYGFPFPNTYYIKAGGGGGGGITRWGLPYLWDFIQDNKLYVMLPLLLTFRPRSCRGEEFSAQGLRPAFVWTYVALVTLPFVAYVVLVGGDFMAMGRFFVPVLPFLAFFTAEGLRDLVERPRREVELWRPVRALVASGLLLGLLTYNSVGLYQKNARLSYHRWGLDTIAYLDKFAADRILIGRWLRENLPPDTYLAVGGAGAIVYASGLKSLDTFGLNDRWIAHHTPPVGNRPGHTKTAPESYLMRERPDLMCHQAKHNNWPYRPAAAEEMRWRRLGYHWVCIPPPGPGARIEGLHPSFYCCLKRMDRALGPWPQEVGS